MLTRRHFSLKSLALVVSELLGRSALAQPWHTARIGVKTPRARRSESIKLDLPALAEDGSVVPVHIAVNLPGVTSISIVADKNPVPLIARFDINAPLRPILSTRIKLAETTAVRVIVHCQDRVYETVKTVRVVQGGCDLPPASS